MIFRYTFKCLNIIATRYYDTERWLLTVPNNVGP